MKKKESVVVFDGEDKFIKPRTRTFDLKAGKSEYVGLSEENPSGQYGYNMGTFVMPDPSDPKFCETVKEYINTRGNGTATPDALMSAYNAFNQFCKGETPSTTTENTTSTTTETTTVTTSTVTDTTTVSASVTKPTPSLVTVSNLGIPPSAAKREKNTKSNINLIYVVIGIGIIGIAGYYFSRNKKK